MQIDLFDARVLAPLVSFLDANGSRSEPLLGRSRIPEQVVREGGWVTRKQAHDFTFDVVERSRCQDAVFAAYQQSFELEHLGPIADAIKSCKTVKEALELATRLGTIAYEGSGYYLKPDGKITWFCYREPPVISVGHAYIADMTLTVYYHLIRLTTNEEWRPERMLTPSQKFDRHRTVDHFEDCRTEVCRNLWALGFPTKFLSRRLPWKEPVMKFDASCAWRFGPDGSEPIVDSLYRLISSLFPYRLLPTLEQVAQMIGASPATIKRQLHASGMSYRRLLDRLRFDAATEMLAVPQMTVNEIARELGYSGTNNFVRSFRRMTGMTPGQYRWREAAALS